MKFILAAVLIPISLFAASCPPPPPTPTPTPGPTPTPMPTPMPQLLLRQPFPPILVRDGQAFNPFGAIQCCMAYNPKILNSKGNPLPRKPKTLNLRGVKATCNTLWPLASECWMDYTNTKGANFYHFRMGPFYGDIAHESEWAYIGGPYLGNGPEWNSLFWEKYRELLLHAWNLGANVEVNVIDTWYCKHAQWGDQEMPWPKEDIEACGRRSSQEQERYIRKVVSEAKEFSNVIWITDNEGDQITGDDCRWFEWVRTVIREEEFRTGGAVRLIGTNNIRCSSGPFDYVATHSRSTLTSPISSKHTENNERNPQFTPEQEYSNFCTAQKAGLHYWFWRAEMNDQDFERTLDLFSQGCNSGIECYAPESEDPLWSSSPNPGGTKELNWGIDSAKLQVGEKCGSDHNGSLNTLGLLAKELRSRGYCASGPWGDALAIRAPDGRWLEYHSVSFADGCWANNSSVLPKNTWSYLGTPHAPQSCDLSVPTVDEILCKLHQATNHIYDCTPKYKGQPILPEGDPQRQACELKSMGGASPTFKVDGGLEILPQKNALQFQIKGSGTGKVTCTVPAVNNTLCNLQVTR